MTNSWSLLYDEIYGEDNMTDENKPITEDDTITISTSGYEGVTSVPDLSSVDLGVSAEIGSVGIDTSSAGPFYVSATDYVTNFGIDNSISGSVFTTDYVSCSDADPWIYESPDGGKTVTRRKSGDDYTKKEVIQKPSIEKHEVHKYEEDKSIKDLKDYISTTYGGHYTSEHNNVQTLDLIESVGDAESFCRSNAIKYLSRYDKKGQAKRDLLKALHYTLLLYYFSGNTKDEITTRGYETF